MSRRSIVIAREVCAADGVVRYGTTAAASACATRMPMAAPAADSRRLSASSMRINRARPAPSASRHSQLVAAIGESREDQRGEIRTGDHQHQSHGGEQHEERLLVLPSNAGIAAGAGSGIRWIRKIGSWPRARRASSPRATRGATLSVRPSRRLRSGWRATARTATATGMSGRREAPVDCPNQIVGGEREDHLGLLTDLETKE